MSARYLTVAVSLAFVARAEAQGPLETVEVIASTPLGADIAADSFPSNVQAATSQAIREQRALDLAEFMNRNLGSVFVNEAQSNPLQPDIQYRGFVGSPLLGLPQGIAVYQDGVRVNEPFGDTVNWALIPNSAIDAVYLMPGSNPLFGLNTLGGAISIETKDGFSHPGSSAEIFAGSFSRLGIQAETGGSIDDRVSYFVTGSHLEEDGWRDFSPTEATQFFANLGWQSDKTALDANLTYANTDLIGNGAAPVELLAVDPKAIFTHPDETSNELIFFNVTSSHSVSDALSLTGNVYARNSDISTFNGDDSDLGECANAPGFLCEEENGGEELLFDSADDPIPVTEAVEGATVNRTATGQDGMGFGLQASWSGLLGGGENLFIAGAAYERNDIGFTSSTELGSLDASRRAVPSGVFVRDFLTRLSAETSNTGLYLSNTFSWPSNLVLTLSGRYNRTEVTLRDQLGTALNGHHEFSRFNPAIGVTLGVSERMTLYAGYSESNRAPSPIELTCADQDDPCRLPNAFLADPPLDNVVAQTIEAGLRGVWPQGRWHAGVFRTTNDNDILFISAGALTNQGFFDNVGRTRRRGVELNVHGEAGGRLSWFANYTVLDATFRDGLVVPSPNNPQAIDGEILVERGHRLPLLPRQSLKAGIRVELSPVMRIGGNLLVSSDFYLRGDEGNVSGRAGGHAVVNLHGEYSVSDRTQLFLKIDNLLDEEYETFGLFGQADEVLGDEFADNRFVSPAAPRAAWVGVRAAF